MCQHIKILFTILLCLGCLTRFSDCCKLSVDCTEVEYWTSWSSCSQSCGYGTKSRYGITASSCSTNLHKTADCYYRRCYTPPSSRSCAWANWEQWSSCTRIGSLGSRSRSRKVSSPAFYGGKTCLGYRYQLDDWCSGGAQVSTQSDSTPCYDRPNPTCEAVSLIPNIAVTSTGYNIMERKVKRSIFDNDNFCGECERVYLGEFKKYFRVPHNIQTFTSLTEVSDDQKVHASKSVSELLNAKFTNYRKELSIGSSFNNNIASLGIQAAGAEERKWTKIIKSSTTSDSKYFTVTTRIEIATFHMNRDDLQLTTEFRNRIAQLPQNYDYGKYASFLSDFGTHYFSEGKLGGTFEAIFEYTRAQVGRFGLTEDQQIAEFTSAMETTLLGVGASTSDSDGRSTGITTTVRNSFIYSATSSEAVVRGGSASTALVLARSKGKTNPGRYSAWADSVRHNPSVIDFKLKPISQLVRNRVKKLNMERALEDLLKLYDAKNCRGRTCKNGGHFVVTDQGKICTCVCPYGYYGTECGYSSS